MKKQLLVFTTAIYTFFCCSAYAQNSNVQPFLPVEEKRGECGTKAPDENWENWFQSRISEFKAQQSRNGGIRAVVTIPIIVHILHNNKAVGTGANIAAAQVEAQIEFLNECMAGKAPGNSSLPAPFSNVDAEDIPIRFCLASKDASGNALSEKGINRINTNSKNWTDPATLTTSNVTSYFDGTIKPGSIWDPKKYFNIWVGDFFDPAKGGLLGWAKFPASSTLTGIPGGSDLESSSNSGVVMATRVFGCKAKYPNGYYANEAYIYGVTTAHEVGHWLGLRHIGGDQSCGNDYCGDTPAQKGGNKNGQNGQNWGCPNYPFQVNGCGSGTSPNGEMFQNFMDYSDDQCRSLFTADQETRMMTALQNSPYRKELGTHGLCSSGPAAVFNADKTVICSGSNITFTDKSGGAPTSWNWTFSGGTPASSTAQNPTITYNTAGSFDVKLVVTNTQGKDSVTKTQYIVVKTAPAGPSVQGDKRCGPGAVTLTAKGSGGSFEWYDAASGGSLLSTGDTYTPVITATTTYYVSESSSTTQKVGAKDTTLNDGSYFTGNDIRGLLFDALAPFKLKSVKVYANTAGERTIEVRQGTGGPVVVSKKVNIPAGESRVVLDFDIQTGNQYHIKVTGTLVDLYRNNGGASYPYTLPGIVSITETDGFAEGFVNYYYYFYDWEVSEAGCASNRSPVTATVNPSPTEPTITYIGNNVLSSSNASSYQWSRNGVAISGATSQTHTASQEGSYTVTITDVNGCTSTSAPYLITNIADQAVGGSFIHIYPNPTGGVLNIKLDLVHEDNYTLELKNVLGQVIYTESLKSFKGSYVKQFDFTAYGRGMYILALKNSSSQQSTRKILVNHGY